MKQAAGSMSLSSPTVLDLKLAAHFDRKFAQYVAADE
jgi:hypothetical protein